MYMLEVKVYDDGSREERTIEHAVASEIEVVSRPVNLYMVGAFVVAIMALLVYRFHIMRGMRYNGTWVLDFTSGASEQKVVFVYTNLKGELVVLSTEGVIGKGTMGRYFIEFTVFGQPYKVRPSQYIMAGDGISMKKVMNQEDA